MGCDVYGIAFYKRFAALITGVCFNTMSKIATAGCQRLALPWRKKSETTSGTQGINSLNLV